MFTFVPAADPSEVLVPGDRVSWRTDTATPRKLSCPPRLQLSSVPRPPHITVNAYALGSAVLGLNPCAVCPWNSVSPSVKWEYLANSVAGSNGKKLWKGPHTGDKETVTTLFGVSRSVESPSPGSKLFLRREQKAQSLLECDKAPWAEP